MYLLGAPVVLLLDLRDEPLDVLVTFRVLQVLLTELGFLQRVVLGR